METVSAFLTVTGKNLWTLAGVGGVRGSGVAYVARAGVGEECISVLVVETPYCSLWGTSCVVGCCPQQGWRHEGLRLAVSHREASH